MPSPARPNCGGANLKYFIGPLKAKNFFKKYPMVTDYFNTEFYFSNACLNSVEHICYYPQQKIKRTDAMFLVLFSL